MGKNEKKAANIFSLSEITHDELGDDDVFIHETISEATKNEEDHLHLTLALGLSDPAQSLGKILKIVETNGGAIIHLETRRRQKKQQHHQKDDTLPHLDALLKLDIKLNCLRHFLKTLKRCNSLESADLISSKAVNAKSNNDTLFLHKVMNTERL